jgi:elongation factor G
VKEYTSENIRNIGLVGHGGVGKTTFAEALLFTLGEINRIGKVAEGTTVSDYHADEIERKVSISTTLLHGDWKETKINCLDMPGFSDFLGDTKGSIGVVDLAVMVLNAVNGMEVGTDLVAEFAEETGRPVCFFINRMDNEHADFEKALKSVQDRFGKGVTAFQFPVQAGEGFNRIVDLIRMKLVTYEAGGTGKNTVSDLPADLQAQAESLRAKIVEAAAESDDRLIEVFFDKGVLTDEELHQGIRKGILERNLIPVLCGSADKNVGSDLFLDFLKEYGPAPSDFKTFTALNEAGQPVERKTSPAEPFCGFVFKTVAEAHVGELSLVRVYSGALAMGSEVLNAKTKQPEKIGQIYTVNGKTRKEIGSLTAGDIGALVKLKSTHTGHTLCDKKSPTAIQAVKASEPVISVAIVPKARGDEDKLSTGLHTLNIEDPSFTVFVDPELHQTIISGQGELHLAVIMRRLKERFGVEVTEEKTRIPYRETITGKADEKYRHKKQTGGAGQFAEVWMRIEPLPRGTGFIFENEVSGGHISGPFVQAVEKGVRQVLETGPLSGCHVIDVKAIVYDGKEHPVDSKDIAFQIAGREAFKQAVLNARPILLEPIYNVEIKVPEDCMGDVMGDLSGRRGKIMGMDSKGHFQVIKAKVPLAELDRYATILRSKTSGRGMFTRAFSHYEPMQKDVETRVVEEFKKHKEHKEKEKEE